MGDFQLENVEEIKKIENQLLKFQQIKKNKRRNRKEVIPKRFDSLEICLGKINKKTNKLYKMV